MTIEQFQALGFILDLTNALTAAHETINSEFESKDHEPATCGICMLVERAYKFEKEQRQPQEG